MTENFSGMEFKKKLPIPKELKEMLPVSREVEIIKEKRDKELKDILSGKDDRLLLIIGPCSADREDAVLDYILRLKKIEEKINDKIMLIPRIYTNKPRTTGDGYKGMLHQPNPEEKPDLFKGITAIRRLHIKAITESGFTCADEMLYPENYRYLSDLISYHAIGARSVENQQHRLTASGLGAPCGIKNPSSGDLTIMMNSIHAAQNSHTFIYRGWEVKTSGNEYAHAVLRGYTDSFGNSHPNYHYEDLQNLLYLYSKENYKNPGVIIDANHSNSGKNYLEQPRIIKEVLLNRKYSSDIKNLVKGFMVESYIEDGAQKVGEGIYGKSITDPCLGIEKTEKLLYEIADMF